ncbi:MAG: heme exporter protein CcmD [Rhodoblastus sp.]
MNADHSFFITLSYAIAGLAVAGMIAAIALDYRRLKKALRGMGESVNARDDRRDLD